MAVLLNLIAPPTEQHFGPCFQLKKHDGDYSGWSPPQF
jgi:hypothetical protein